MNSGKLILLIGLASTFVQASRLSPEPVIFVASSPCDMIPRVMLSIPASADCELIKWNLVLQRDPRNQMPAAYTLTYTYGMSQAGTMDFTASRITRTKKGRWAIQKTSRNREIYVLTPDTAQTAISFVKLDDNLVHLLDQQGKLMIGHGGWSYTLNRK